MHYGVGVHAAEKDIDVLICIGELTAATVQGAMETAEEKGLPTEIHYFKTKEDFFKEAGDILKRKDTILIKASHGMGFTEIVEQLKDRQTQNF